MTERPDRPGLPAIRPQSRQDLAALEARKLIQAKLANKASRRSLTMAWIALGVFLAINAAMYWQLHRGLNHLEDNARAFNQAAVLRWAEMKTSYDQALATLAALDEVNKQEITADLDRLQTTMDHWDSAMTGVANDINEIAARGAEDVRKAVGR